MNEMNRELGWEDEIEKEGSDFILLPEGEYDFVIDKFERGRHPGSEKLPPCNKAVLYVKIETPEGTATIKHNLFLHTITEGMLSSFFTAIGQKKHGEKVRMNWAAVTGARGRCKVGIRTFIKNDGSEGKSNEIKRFIEPDGNAAPKFTAGAF